VSAPGTIVADEIAPVGPTGQNLPGKKENGMTSTIVEIPAPVMTAMRCSLGDWVRGYLSGDALPGALTAAAPDWAVVNFGKEQLHSELAALLPAALQEVAGASRSDRPAEEAASEAAAEAVPSAEPAMDKTAPEDCPGPAAGAVTAPEAAMMPNPNPGGGMTPEGSAAKAGKSMVYSAAVGPFAVLGRYYRRSGCMALIAGSELRPEPGSCARTPGYLRAHVALRSRPDLVEERDGKLVLLRDVMTASPSAAMAVAFGYLVPSSYWKTETGGELCAPEKRAEPFPNGLLIDIDMTREEADAELEKVTESGACSFNGATPPVLRPAPDLATMTH